GGAARTLECVHSPEIRKTLYSHFFHQSDALIFIKCTNHFCIRWKFSHIKNSTFFTKFYLITNFFHNFHWNPFLTSKVLYSYLTNRIFQYLFVELSSQIQLGGYGIASNFTS